MFDKHWHKIHIGVNHNRVELYVDCEEASSVLLKPRGEIDPHGIITLAKMAASSQTVPVSTLELIFISILN